MEEKLSFENDDILDRKKIAENITRIIENSDEFNVIAIDSSWGTGKTTFIKKWETMLHSGEYEGKFKTLYFNAWKNDYMKDPFAALLTAIDNENSELKESFKTAVSAGIGITKGVTDIFLKLATAGAIGVKEFTDIKDEIFDGIKNEQSTREEFLSEIEQIASGGPKTIFFIDEIDRCRPTFAIELLETIKHLFSAKNIYFIISVDKIQLSHSIKSLYGEGMDADGYLRRFFDLEFMMPINLYSYIEHKTAGLRVDSKEIVSLISLLEDLIMLEKYSLRDIDKTYGYIKLLIPNLIDNCMFLICKENDKKYFITLILAYLINLKVKHSEIYHQVINQKYNIEDIESIVETVNINGSNNIRRDMQHHFEGYLDRDFNIDASKMIETYLYTIKEFITHTGNIDNSKYRVYGMNIAEIIMATNFNKNFISLLEILNDFTVNR